MAERLASLRRWAVAALLAASAVGPALTYGNGVYTGTQWNLAWQHVLR